MTIPDNEVRKFDINAWLHNEYGLIDGDLLDAGQVEDLAELLVNDIRKTDRESLRKEVERKKIVGDTKNMKESDRKRVYNLAIDDVLELFSDKE